MTVFPIPLYCRRCSRAWDACAGPLGGLLTIAPGEQDRCPDCDEYGSIAMSDELTAASREALTETRDD